MMKKIFILFTIVIILVSVQEVFAHGGENKDRAPIIDFKNKDVTVMTKMNPPDMTIGNFSNAFLDNEDYEYEWIS